MCTRGMVIWPTAIFSSTVGCLPASVDCIISNYVDIYVVCSIVQEPYPNQCCGDSIRTQPSWQLKHVQTFWHKLRYDLNDQDHYGSHLMILNVMAWSPREVSWNLSHWSRDSNHRTLTPMPLDGAPKRFPELLAAFLCNFGDTRCLEGPLAPGVLDKNDPNLDYRKVTWDIFWVIFSSFRQASSIIIPPFSYPATECFHTCGLGQLGLPWALPSGHCRLQISCEWRGAAESCDRNRWLTSCVGVWL